MIDPSTFDQDGADLDGLCIRTTLADVVAAWLAGKAGDSYNPDVETMSEDDEGWMDDATELLDHLIELGLIRREWYAWDETNDVIVPAHTPIA